MDWGRISNPVHGLGRYSLKDASVVRRDGVYHIFSSAFNEEDSRILRLTTRDWVTFVEPEVIVAGSDLDAVGACSPDVSFDGENYVLAFNSWGQPKANPNQLFVKTSHDLATWSEPIRLAPNLTVKRRCIDAALAWSSGIRFLVWKEEAITRFAMARRLEGPWRVVPPDGCGRLVRADGTVPQSRGVIHENFQIFRADGVWYLLSTDFEPHEPWLYRMAGDPADPESWLHWHGGVRLDLPAQGFNSIPVDAECVRARDFTRPVLPCRDNLRRVQIVDGLCNAPFIWDQREQDGCFYMLYAGKNEEGRNAFNGTAGSHDRVGGWARGWNRLALARSRDLQHWEAARDGCD